MKKQMPSSGVVVVVWLCVKKHERSNASMVPLLSLAKGCAVKQEGWRGFWAWHIYMGDRCITFLCACRLALCSEHNETSVFLDFPCLILLCVWYLLSIFGSKLERIVHFTTVSWHLGCLIHARHAPDFTFLSFTLRD